MLLRISGMYSMVYQLDSRCPVANPNYYTNGHPRGLQGWDGPRAVGVGMNGSWGMRLAIAQAMPPTLSIAWTAPQSTFSKPSMTSSPLYSVPLRTPLSIGSLGGLYHSRFPAPMGSSLSSHWTVFNTVVPRSEPGRRVATQPRCTTCLKKLLNCLMLQKSNIVLTLSLSPPSPDLPLRLMLLGFPHVPLRLTLPGQSPFFALQLMRPGPAQLLPHLRNFTCSTATNIAKILADLFPTPTHICLNTTSPSSVNLCQQGWPRDYLRENCQQYYHYQWLGWKDELRDLSGLFFQCPPCQQSTSSTTIPPHLNANYQCPYPAPTFYQSYQTFMIEDMKTLLTPLNTVSSSSKSIEPFLRVPHPQELEELITRAISVERDLAKYPATTTTHPIKTPATTSEPRLPRCYHCPEYYFHSDCPVLNQRQREMERSRNDQARVQQGPAYGRQEPGPPNVINSVVSTTPQSYDAQVLGARVTKSRATPLLVFLVYFPHQPNSDKVVDKVSTNLSAALLHLLFYRRGNGRNKSGPQSTKIPRVAAPITRVANSTMLSSNIVNTCKYKTHVGCNSLLACPLDCCVMLPCLGKVVLNEQDLFPLIAELILKILRFSGASRSLLRGEWAGAAVSTTPNTAWPPVLSSKEVFLRGAARSFARRHGGDYHAQYCMSTGSFVKSGLPRRCCGENHAQYCMATGSLWRSGENHSQYSMATGSFAERSSFFDVITEQKEIEKRRDNTGDEGSSRGMEKGRSEDTPPRKWRSRVNPARLNYTRESKIADWGKRSPVYQQLVLTLKMD
uniref:Uncharacterized protein n=1 Tax=Timema douglasi TaxID=61478 RepID=A0A7R8ZDF5_TIMDO|nr:unnamed protein product [Timema douglasi]